MPSQKTCAYTKKNNKNHGAGPLFVEWNILLDKQVLEQHYDFLRRSSYVTYADNIRVNIDPPFGS
jgi:hypothetical protein